MKKKAMVLLVGHQNAPNFLPVLHIQPTFVYAFYTEETTAQNKRLVEALKEKKDWEIEEIREQIVDPYNISSIQNDMYNFLQDQSFDGSVVFNLTGGTKAMVLAAYEIARKTKETVVYFQTEGKKDLLYEYDMTKEKPELTKKESITANYSIKEYLKLYVDGFKYDPKNNIMETAVQQSLNSADFIDEKEFSIRFNKLSNDIELDFVIRCGNQIGIGEVKSRASKRVGVDQLKAVTGQRTLGTYAHTFLVSDVDMHVNTQELMKAYRMKYIKLEDYQQNDASLSEADRERLLSAIREKMIR